MTDERWETLKECGRRLALALAMLPLLYVLSTGPVVRWYRQRASNGTLTRRQEKGVERFYAPLILAYDNSRPVARAFDWYFGLWHED